MIRLLCLLLALAFPAFSQTYTYRAIIVSVYDGDTATVDIDIGFNVWMRDQTLRFYCINTPEIRGPEKVRGIPIRDEVREWLPVGSKITLQTVQDRRGKYGRWLAVITPDGWSESVNARLYRERKARIEAYDDKGRAACLELLN